MTPTYIAWRAAKLACHGMPQAISIGHPAELTGTEQEALAQLRARNLALFRLDAPIADIERDLRVFGRHIGLLDRPESVPRTAASLRSR